MLTTEKIRQRTFFEDPPVAAARKSDPATSHLAAASVEASGHAETHRQLCLRVVSAQAGLTSAEIAVKAGLDRHEAARRLADLERGGEVRKGTVKLCSVCGSKCVTWWRI